MYVTKEMRINRFEPRPYVSNRELFIAKGDCSSSLISEATSECYSEPTVQGASKTKMLGLAKDIGDTAIAKHKSAGKAKSLPGDNAKDQ